MDHLDLTVRTILALAASYQTGAILEAEKAVDTYLAAFHGFQNRKAAIDGAAPHGGTGAG
ncbi:hypothetical protein [Methylobacterium soli]|uniref:Uncharacterized protein n=1 Tax=Methylobacterium soli TaxID=553447 RepID=A0A6L3SW21_9HYPH|nr:hypothetical protein [Methylobacterium soli]KAB1070798.1 hypothetical protein F6X53_29680 [Methylobacterium soli]